MSSCNFRLLADYFFLLLFKKNVNAFLKNCEHEGKQSNLIFLVTDVSIIASVTFFLPFSFISVFTFCHVTNRKKQNYTAYFHDLELFNILICKHI